MKVSQLFPSKYLKKEDVPSPVTLTIQKFAMETIKGDKGEETKPVIHFMGGAKPMVVNTGNATLLDELYGDTDNWAGKQITVYTDPNVMFGGKRIGGLRLRKPEEQAF